MKTSKTDGQTKLFNDSSVSANLHETGGEYETMRPLHQEIHVYGGNNGFCEDAVKVYQGNDALLSQHLPEGDAGRIKKMSQDELNLFCVLRDVDETEACIMMLRHAQTHVQVSEVVMTFVGRRVITSAMAKKESFLIRLQPFCTSLEGAFSVKKVREHYNYLCSLYYMDDCKGARVGRKKKNPLANLMEPGDE